MSLEKSYLVSMIFLFCFGGDYVFNFFGKRISSTPVWSPFPYIDKDVPDIPNPHLCIQICRIEGVHHHTQKEQFHSVTKHCHYLNEFMSFCFKYYILLFWRLSKNLNFLILYSVCMYGCVCSDNWIHWGCSWIVGCWRHC